MLLTNQCIYSE